MAVAGYGAPILPQAGRIAVQRDGRTVWRSRGRFRAIGVFALAGPDAVAFSYDDYGSRRHTEFLYLASFGGRERRLALNERPLGWLPDGQLLTWRYRQGLIGLYLRDRRGRLLRQVGAGLREIRFDQTSRTVLALNRRGVLERLEQREWQPLATLPALGLDRQASFERLSGGLIGILDRRRATVLRTNGSVFASARFRVGDVAGESGLVANAAGTEVAFAVTNTVAGWESIYVLRSGDHAARECYAGRVQFAVCERWATLAWHGSWLLYATTEGKTLVLNTSSQRAALDLSPVVRKLAPRDGEGNVDAQIEWTT